MHDNPEPIGAADTVDAAVLLRLEHAVADLLTGADAEHDLLAPLLETVGSALGWPVGAVWGVPDRLDGDSPELRRLEDSPELRCLVVWRAPGVEVDEFVAASRRLRLPAGVGLPGRVWRSGRPAWIRDAAQDGNFPPRAGGRPGRPGRRVLLPDRQPGRDRGTGGVLLADAAGARDRAPRHDVQPGPPHRRCAAPAACRRCRPPQRGPPAGGRRLGAGLRDPG